MYKSLLRALLQVFTHPLWYAHDKILYQDIWYESEQEILVSCLS